MKQKTTGLWVGSFFKSNLTPQAQLGIFGFNPHRTERVSPALTRVSARQEIATSERKNLFRGIVINGEYKF